jgi:hypothetical protein
MKKIYRTVFEAMCFDSKDRQGPIGISEIAAATKLQPCTQHIDTNQGLAGSWW